MSHDITPFEAIRRTNPAGNEFWSSRDFAKVSLRPRGGTRSRTRDRRSIDPSENGFDRPSLEKHPQVRVRVFLSKKTRTREFGLAVFARVSFAGVSVRNRAPGSPSPQNLIGFGDVL
jgi:hypothetical protein